jgi:hypothetical protein
MSPRLFIGIVSFSVFMTGIFLGNMFMVMMIGEINRKMPDENLVSYFGFTYSKLTRIFHEYRQSYPGGKLHIYYLVALGACLAGILGVAVCLRII